MAASGMILIILALGVLVLPLQWLFAVVMAAAFHELCHWIAVRLCGGEVRDFKIELNGAQMTVEGLTPMTELICALSGPIGGICLLMLARWIPRTAICAAFQSLYNLLPVYPLDGGRVLRCVGTILGAGEWLYPATERICLIVIALLGLYGTFYLKVGVFPLFVAAWMILRAKRPCKAERFSVQ